MPWSSSVIPDNCSVCACAIDSTARATSADPAMICSSELRTVFENSTPRPTRSLADPTSSVVLRAASPERVASARTSCATTANPRPASPARAASTAALSASRLVWNAISSITRTIWPISRAARSISPMECSSPSTAFCAEAASCVPCSVRLRAPSDSSLVRAVCSRSCVTAADISSMLAAWPLATPDSDSLVLASVDVSPASSVALWRTPEIEIESCSPSWLTATPIAPNSSVPSSLMRAVRSPRAN